MDYQIVWTLRSRQDLRNIASFIAKDNPSAALKFGDLIFARVDMLEKFPEIGRIVLERLTGSFTDCVSRKICLKSCGSGTAPVANLQKPRYPRDVLAGFAAHVTRDQGVSIPNHSERTQRWGVAGDFYG